MFRPDLLAIFMESHAAMFHPHVVTTVVFTVIKIRL